MLAGIANYLLKISVNKLGLTPFYKNVSRFILHSKIIKGIKTHKFLNDVAKQRFMKNQRKFYLFTNFFITRLYYNFKHFGLKRIVKQRLRRKILPQQIRSAIFCWKTIKYFKTIGEKADGYVALLEDIYQHLESRADYCALWVMGRYVNETERLKEYKKGKWVYQYADILESLMVEKAQMKILLSNSDKYYEDEEE